MPKRPPQMRRPDRLVHQDERQRQTAKDMRRGTAASRGYDRQWRKVRKLVLQDEPLCRVCKADGITTPATDVDHIDGNSRNNDRANLRPLCHACHSRRTARDQGFARGRGAGPISTAQGS